MLQTLRGHPQAVKTH